MIDNLVHLQRNLLQLYESEKAQHDGETFAEEHALEFVGFSLPRSTMLLIVCSEEIFVI